MSESEKRRKDDTFIRNIVRALIVGLLIQGIGWVYLLGSINNQVEENTKAINYIRNVNDRLVRIEVMLEMMQKSTDNFIDEASKHIDNKDVHTP